MAMTRRTLLSLVALCAAGTPSPGMTGGRVNATRAGASTSDEFTLDNQTDRDHAEPMKIYYLEIVTKDVEAVCTLYSTTHGLTFGAADTNLGGARTTRLAHGELLGVRAPLHEGERPVVRPYGLVENLDTAVAAAARAGAEVIVPPMKIPGHGTCAIVYLGGIESGLWQA